MDLIQDCDPEKTLLLVKSHVIIRSSNQINQNLVERKMSYTIQWTEKYQNNQLHRNDWNIDIGFCDLESHPSAHMQVSKKFWQVSLPLFLQQLLKKKKNSHKEPNQSPTEWSTWLQWKPGLSKDCRKKPHHVTANRMSRENKWKFPRTLAENFQNNRRNWKLDVQVPCTDFEMLSHNQKQWPRQGSKRDTRWLWRNSGTHNPH